MTEGCGPENIGNFDLIYLVTTLTKLGNPDLVFHIFEYGESDSDIKNSIKATGIKIELVWKSLIVRYLEDCLAHANLR